MADAPLTPPYVAFSTFWNFLQELHGRGSAPQVFEASVFGPTRSGATRSQLLIALRFFGFIDGEKRATDRLRMFLQQPDQEALRELVEAAYAEIIALDLQTATPGQVDEVLREMGAGQGATLRKARTFFVHAAKQAGIEVGPHLATGTGSVRTSSSSSRKGRGRRTTSMESTSSEPKSFATGLHPFLQGLIQELPEDGRWSKTQRDRWLEMARLTVDMLYETEPED